MGSSKSMKGAGSVAGAEEQDRRGPGSSKQVRGKPDSSMLGMTDAASGKGIKPKNRTRGREEDGA